MSAHIHLVNPKTPANVGGVLRALSIFGAGDERLTWSGERVHDALLRYTGGTLGKKTKRLPREERMKQYNIDWGRDDDGLRTAIAEGMTPVCIEIVPGAILLPEFEHPEDAVYVFGPEDGSVPKGTRHACHYFVTIPTKNCGNLAAMANVVLYDRLTKILRDGGDLPWQIRGELVGR
jgi:tRNA(Leu) C34 or U34 (ribose-2'-O)-methylase TrmL